MNANVFLPINIIRPAAFATPGAEKPGLTGLFETRYGAGQGDNERGGFCLFFLDIFFCALLVFFVLRLKQVAIKFQ